MPATVEINLARVRRNAANVAARAGVPLLAVVKADAYGLGVAAIADALCGLGDRLDGFYVFDAAEAAGLHARTGRRTVALHGTSADPADYRDHRIQPVVWTVDRASALQSAGPVLSLDTGQQRFGCPAVTAADVYRAGDCREVMTHATRSDQAEQLARFAAELTPRPTRHAAGSALLDDSAARLDLVRPGLALYRGAVRVSAPVVEARDTAGRPAGYTGFCVPRIGVVVVGYRNGLRPGPCRVGGQPSRVLEVGMQSAFVELPADVGVGANVILLGSDAANGGDTLSESAVAESAVAESAVAAAWRVSEQEVLVRLTAAGPRQYRDR